MTAQKEDYAYIVLFITTATADEAHKIAETLLEQRIIACANIVPSVSSIFRWQGKLDSAQESLLIAKTKASELNEAVKLVKETHSYDTPELIAVPIIGGNSEYLDWIGKEVKKAEGVVRNAYQR